LNALFIKEDFNITLDIIGNEATKRGDKEQLGLMVLGYE